MTEELRNICDSDTKQEEQALGILARLFRQLLYKGTGVNVPDVNYQVALRLIDAWLKDPANGVPDDMKRRSSARGNLMKEIARPDMTFRVFLKGVRWLRPQDVTFTVDLGYAHGAKRSARIRINLRQMNIDLEGFDDKGEEG